MIYTNINDIQREYKMILADPPWQQHKTLRKNRPNQKKQFDYPVLTLDEIKEHLRIATEHTSENAILFLWTIEKYLFEAQQIAESLGWKLHVRMIWDKTNGIAPSYDLRYSHEYLLYMWKGSFPRVDKNIRGKYTTVFRESSKKHSQKPEISFKIIEDLYPAWGGLQLEMYARSVRPGWDSFGNEIENKGGVENES